jgi:hypothetical protein
VDLVVIQQAAAGAPNFAELCGTLTQHGVGHNQASALIGWPCSTVSSRVGNGKPSGQAPAGRCVRESGSSHPARDFVDGVTKLDNRGTPHRVEHPLPKPTRGWLNHG